MSAHDTVRFSVIGINHGHIYSQVRLMLRAGAELVSFYAPEPDLAAQFSNVFPQVPLARSAEEILEDASVHAVLSAGIPCERAPLGIDVMQHGKDYMVDKPGFTTLEQLAEAEHVQAETRRIYSVCYSERFEVRSSVKAGELVKAGAIGKVVQTLGLGPHRMRPETRPPWFFRRDQYGGIITDIGSHQMDQFLYFTGSTSARVVSSRVGNFKYPEWPELEEFGEAMLEGDGGTGYVRVDWYTPEGLSTWGDGRLFVLGTEGYIEARKYVDPAGRSGGDHIFLVDQQGTHYVDCSDTELPYGRQLVHDILNRTETAMTQEHCFLASRLGLEAEANALRVGNLS
jgi:predicted dehydrogenase